MLGAVELDVEQAGEEAALAGLAHQFARIDRDELVRLAVAIEDAGHAAVAARRAGGALPGLVARLGAQSG